MRIHIDLSPLDGVINVWVVGSPVSMVLKGLGNTIIQPGNVGSAECTISIVMAVASPVAKSKVSNLHAKFPMVSIIINVSSGLFVMEFLMRVLLNPLIKVAWYSWEVMETGGIDPVFVFTSNNQWSSLLFGSDGVEIHASAWLHGGGHWLSNLLCEFWYSVAFNNFNIEVNIGTEWDWFSSNWSPCKGGTINIV
jgi:hypothetical protein